MSLIKNRLRDRRKELGLTMKDVSSAIGVSLSTYREWEYGRSIQGEPYIELARVLKLGLVYLLSGSTSEREPLLDSLVYLEDRISDIKENLLLGNG